MYDDTHTKDFGKFVPTFSNRTITSELSLFKESDFCKKGGVSLKVRTY